MQCKAGEQTVLRELTTEVEGVRVAPNGLHHVLTERLTATSLTVQGQNQTLESADLEQWRGKREANQELVQFQVSRI